MTSRPIPAMKALSPQKIVPPTWNSGSVAVSVSLGAHVAQHRAAERGHELAAVRVRHQARRAGGAAGVEVGRHVAVAARLTEHEAIVGLRHQRCCGSRSRRPRAGVPGGATRSSVSPGTCSRSASAFCQMSSTGCGPSATRMRAPDACSSAGDVLRLEQEVDRHRVAGGLGAPQRGVRLDQARQHVGHAGPRAAERGKQVGGAPHQAEQLAVARRGAACSSGAPVITS